MGRKILTIEKTIKILAEIKNSNGATTTDLSETLDMSTSGVHAYVKTLEDHHLLAKEGNEYNIGLGFLHYGEYSRKRRPEYKFIEAIVDELSENTQEGTDFCVSEGAKMFTVYNSVASAEDPAFHVGRTFHMHNSATGKAILAESPRELVNEVIDRYGLPKETENTITDPEELYQELEQVRERGYAFNEEEVLLGLQGVGAVVKRPDSSIVGALSVGGPSYRVQGDKLYDDLVDNLLTKKNKLEEMIYSYYRKDPD